MAADSKRGNLELRIGDVTSPTLGVRSDESSSQILSRMKAFGVDHVIVTGDEGICGVVSDVDLAAADPDAPVGGLAVEVPVIDSQSPIGEAAMVMRNRRVGCVPVVDGNAIAGVITIERLLELIGEGTMQAKRRRR